MGGDGMSEWKKVKLGEVCEISAGGDRPQIFSNHRTDKCRIPIYSNGIDNEGLYGFTDTPKNNGNAITITGRGANAGTVFYRKDPFLSIIRLLTLTPNSEIINAKYLFYLLKDKTFLSTGSAQPQITVPNISQFEIEFNPDIETQHRIATILSRYDSLIENYQKQIKLLEEAAQRLYKEWFIDLHFPGHENTNILDGVPEGWEKKKLCEFTGITDGTHDSPKQVEIGLPLVTGRCIVDGSIDFSQAYNISEEDVIKINKRSAVEDGDILLSNIGTIGKVCRISKSGNYAVKNMIIFKPHDAIHSCFLHRFLTDNNTQMDFLQQAAGTSQKFVSLSFIRNTLILRPSDTILNLFYNHSEKYFNYVQTLQSQLRLLTEARDRLLPKLMSGEIEI